MSSAALELAIKRSRMTPRTSEPPVSLVKPPGPSVQKVNIRDLEPAGTAVEVTACAGQIVIVTPKAAIVGAAAFHRLDALPGEKIRVEHIQRAVCREFGISREDIVSARRTANVVRPRQIAMYLAKTLTLRSLPDIGRRFGGRDHTTVLHAVRRIGAAVTTDPALSQTVSTIKAHLGIDDDCPQLGGALPIERRSA